jgi:simple sugar transport system permease protein
MRIKVRMPQMIMSVYLVILLIAASHIGISPASAFGNALTKVAMNGILVLSLIPMINCGMGMNFGMPIGVTAGTLGMLMSIQLRVTGMFGLATSIAIGVVLAAVFGSLYSLLLNRLKGNEEIVGMFTAFSFLPVMNIFYTMAPFTNRQMLYPVGGVGLRPKINLETYFADVLDRMMTIRIGDMNVSTGIIVFYLLVGLCVFYIFRTKLGDAITAVSENEKFAVLSGVDVSKVRMAAVVASSAIAAIGICVYSQSYGFVEAYDAPLNIVFPAISAILIGGASRRRASVSHAIIGTILYQTTYLLSVPVANQLLVPQMAEIMRMIVTNGIILYAFLFEGRGIAIGKHIEFGDKA